jgi:hypothetical protein
MSSQAISTSTESFCNKLPYEVLAKIFTHCYVGTEREIGKETDECRRKYTRNQISEQGDRENLDNESLHQSAKFKLSQ